MRSSPNKRTRPDAAQGASCFPTSPPHPGVCSCQDRSAADNTHGRRAGDAHEKLGAVGVGSAVGHGKEALVHMLARKGLICPCQ